MALEEKISEHLGKPYVYLKDQKKFLCSNGVIFTLEEYKNGIDINKEYERRAKEDELYDYSYAKNTGLLRKKKNERKDEEIPEIIMQNAVISENTSDKHNFTESTETNSEALNRFWNSKISYPFGWNENNTNRQEEKQGNTVLIIVTLLSLTSLISGYISTLHTAIYLYDYVDVFSSWLMSTSVTTYNATAFEVAVIFKGKKRFGLTFVFIMLWSMVTLFSMATTISVFYGRFNFTETQLAEENKQSDSNRLSLELLRTKEKDLRESISFKKQDIQYRQEHDYATTAVRTELNGLQKELQENLSEQERLLKETPEAVQTEVKRKESLFGFLGRLLHIDGGVLEFIMSTLSAVFVNLISPLSLTAVTELLKKKA